MRYTVFSLMVFALAFSAPPSYALEFGIVMDVSGTVFIQRGRETVPPDLGLNVSSGDTITLGEGSSIVIVSYSDCSEWVLKGPDRITIRGELIAGKRPTRQLPVCYSPEEFKEGDAHVIGGFVLRGQPGDPLASLRDEFERGEASNSTLMTLIMSDLSSGEAERARPYFEALRSRMPGSEFVKTIAKKFEED